MNFSKLTGPAAHVLRNIRKMLAIAWEMDKRLTFGYYATGALAALGTLVASVTLKYLIDNIITPSYGTLAGSIPLIILVVLGVRYLVNAISWILQRGLNQFYFDYLFRYKLQNFLALRFYRKVSGLDVAYLEDPKTQDLITKVRDTMLWRPSDFLRNFSYFLNGSVAFAAAFLVLLPFGWWIPVVISLSTLPLLVLRAKYGSPKFTPQSEHPFKNSPAALATSIAVR